VQITTQKVQNRQMLEWMTLNLQNLADQARNPVRDHQSKRRKEEKKPWRKMIVERIKSKSRRVNLKSLEISLSFLQKKKCTK